MLKPKLVDIGRLGSDRFQGSQHLGRGPETLDWFTISGAAALSSEVRSETGRIFGSLSKSELITSGRRTDNDATNNSGHTQRMNEITREEFNAKIETIETKMDARVESVSAKIEAFLMAQAERDKAQLERDKRYELLADRVTTAAEGAEEAAKQAATVKSNYWAAVGVQLVAVAAILVGAYFATQANTLSAISTTLSAFQAGKAEPPMTPSAVPQSPSK